MKYKWGNEGWRLSEIGDIGDYGKGTVTSENGVEDNKQNKPSESGDQATAVNPNPNQKRSQINQKLENRNQETVVALLSETCLLVSNSHISR